MDAMRYGTVSISHVLIASLLSAFVLVLMFGCTSFKTADDLMRCERICSPLLASYQTCYSKCK